MMADGVNQSPIFRLKRGDALALTLHNELTPTAEDVNAPPPQFCGAVVTTGSSTNIHFHGSHVPPECHKDEIVKTRINAGQNFTFGFTFPMSQPLGLLWYHPHASHSTVIQVDGGATGAFIVEGIESVQPAVGGLPEQILNFRSEHIRLGVTDMPGMPRPFMDVSLNFIPIQYPDYITPVMTIKPGEQQFWRVVNTMDGTFLAIEFRINGTAQPLVGVARDDVALGQGATAEMLTQTQWLLSPAGRIELIITGPVIGMTGDLYTADMTAANLLPSPERPLLHVIADINAPTPNKLAPAPATTELRYPEDLLKLTPAASRQLEFSEDGGMFTITPVGQPRLIFQDQTYPSINATQGTVEDWTLINPTGGAHHFHIHQMHFILIAANGVPVAPEEMQYYDTINVPKGENITVRLDLLGEFTVGVFVYHCHIFAHSDIGMMSLFQVLPAPTASSSAPTALSSIMPSSSHSFQQTMQPSSLVLPLSQMPSPMPSSLPSQLPTISPSVQPSILNTPMSPSVPAVPTSPPVSPLNQVKVLSIFQIYTGLVCDDFSSYYIKIAFYQSVAQVLSIDTSRLSLLGCSPEPGPGAGVVINYLAFYLNTTAPSISDMETLLKYSTSSNSLQSIFKQNLLSFAASSGDASLAAKADVLGVQDGTVSSVDNSPTLTPTQQPQIAITASIASSTESIGTDIIIIIAVAASVALLLLVLCICCISRKSIVEHHSSAPNYDAPDSSPGQRVSAANCIDGIDVYV